jgi:hypothetical protein
MCSVRPCSQNLRICFRREGEHSVFGIQIKPAASGYLDLDIKVNAERADREPSIPPPFLRNIHNNQGAITLPLRRRRRPGRIAQYGVVQAGKQRPGSSTSRRRVEGKVCCRAFWMTSLASYTATFLKRYLLFRCQVSMPNHAHVFERAESEDRVEVLASSGRNDQMASS